MFHFFFLNPVTHIGLGEVLHLFCAEKKDVGFHPVGVSPSDGMLNLMCIDVYNLHDRAKSRF